MWKNLKKRIKIIVIFAGFTIVYLSVGYFLHLIVFPEKVPDIANYFQPGDVFKSDFEGFTQTIIRQEKGKVYCKLELAPFAPGPPVHVHTDFDEFFENGNKVMSIIINNDTIVLQPHENRLIPKGTPHKPFNPTPDTVRLTMKKYAFPEEFAFYLNQLYGYVDESEDNLKPPKVLFQMAMFNQSFDSYLTKKAPPIAVQKFTNFMIVPLARLLGYKSYYPKYDIKQ